MVLVATKAFDGPDGPVTPGQILDASSWRNAQRLVATRYARPARLDEVLAMQSPPSAPAPPAPPAPAPAKETTAQEPVAGDTTTPAAGEGDGAGTGDADTVDPPVDLGLSTLTVPAAQPLIAEAMSVDTLTAWRDLEEQGAARKGITQAIDARIAVLTAGG